MRKQVSNIVHMDMDTFFVSVERLLDPKLHNRPVIVGGSPYGRGVVAGCSYEARAYGVHSAMPIRQAFRLCPKAVFLHGHYIHYAEYSRYVTKMLEDIAPIVEKSSVDEFYLDLSHTERLKGDAYRWAQLIQKEINGDTKLPLSFGLATNKLVAKVATTERAKRVQGKHFRVEPGKEREFFAPMEVAALPGVGPVMERELIADGYDTIGRLASGDVSRLQKQYGKVGYDLVQKANGIDHRIVAPTVEQKSYSREETYYEDTLDVNQILATLLSLSSRLAQDLREGKVLTEKITLKLRYSDFQTVTKTINTSYTNSDQDIYKLALKLFTTLWTRRVRVRLLGIDASSLLNDLKPAELFDDPIDERKNQLSTVFDALREKYGNTIIGYAPALSLA